MTSSHISSSDEVPMRDEITRFHVCVFVYLSCASPAFTFARFSVMAILIVKNIILAQWLVLIPLLLLILVAGQWMWYQRKNRKLLKVANTLPSPAPVNIVLGNWYRTKKNLTVPAFTGEDFTHYIINSMRIAAEKPYSGFSMWLGPVPYIFIQKPHDAKIVLNSSKAVDRGPDVKFLDFALGDGIVTASGTRWKIIRRYMNPIFHHENIKTLIDVFNRVGHQLVHDLASHVGGAPFDVLQPVFKASVASVSGLVFGPENQRKMKNDDFILGASYVTRMITCAGERTFKPWLWSDQAFYFIYKNKLKDLENTWTHFRRRAVSDNGISEEFYTVTKAYKNILQDHSMFSEANLDEEMKTILASGSDTTAIGLSSCLMLLATHPDIQEKLHNEIKDLLGSEDQDVTIQDINNLPYLDQVIKESLRMSTVLVLIQRTLSEDLQLSECTIPKGGNVILSVIGLHFDPEVYPDPYVFNPERFTPENMSKRDSYSYIPFSAGPRNCIGKQYAMTSMKIMLAYILRAYKVSTSENLLDLRFLVTITLSSIDGYKIRLDRRT